MYALYLFSVWLHILAAMTWIGGMLFLVLVVVPWLRRGGREHAGAFLRATGRRFRTVGWGCFVVLALTGTFNLWMRGVRLTDFVRPEWLASPFGRAVLSKLGVFVAILIVSAAHDFVVGPRATSAIAASPRSSEVENLRRQASVLGRANAFFALVIVALAVMVVRGAPW
jgi:uncharacterized membrane protein